MRGVILLGYIECEKCGERRPAEFTTFPRIQTNESLAWGWFEEIDRIELVAGTFPESWSWYKSQGKLMFACEKCK